ncbi:MAG TPA: SpoIIE family protein phosphatase [Terriglobales bacterium]|nr:SpoIIE family protein phosphatase [Terriglobales bacterium]
MEIASTEYVAITDASSVGEARRRGLLMAEKLGFDEVRTGEFALLITEVSRNVLAHAQAGQTILMGLKNSRGAVARILAMDNGPGITDIARAMHDGYSTGGTMGGGMGAMKRVATLLEIFTSQNGTIVLLEIRTAPAPDNDLQVAGMAVPYPGERLCGDAWACHRTAELCSILLVDGLGHGRMAAEAADEAIQVFRQRAGLPPGEILSYIDDGLKKTRGAVAAIAEIRAAEKILTYGAVGNTMCTLLSRQTSRNLMSHNGTLGVASPRIPEFRIDWPDDGILVMHSDGLASRWDLSTYSGLLARHPAVIGGALLRDFRRQRDDASVVVVKAAA